MRLRSQDHDLVESASGLNQVHELHSGYVKINVITGTDLHASVLDGESVDTELFFHWVTLVFTCLL
jgi:hypothetical protein